MRCAVWKLLFFTFLLPTLAAAQYRFDHWTVDDGLPQNSVYSITQTTDGYIWFTTFDGLVRFDGVRFTVFNKSNHKNLPGNRFVKLFAEADNTLWIATDESGLVRYRKGEFQTFTMADGLLANRVYEIQKDTDGSLLISTLNGTMRWRDEKFSVERQEDIRRFKVYLAPSGIRWEMDQSGLRSTGRDGRETVYTLPFAADKISTDRTFNYFLHVNMFEDREGALWFAAAGNVYRLKDGAISVLTKENNVPPSLVRVIAQDGAGAIWLGTQENGACRLQANRFDCFDKSSGISSENIYDIYTDREGTLWLGTNESGINRATNRAITPLSTAEGLADKNVYPILEDKTGGVWIGSFSALSYYKDGKIKNYTYGKELLYESVQSLYEDDAGRLWVGGIGGVSYLENGKFYDYTEKLDLTIGDYDFWDIHQDRRGAFWFATNKGLIKYADGAATKFTTADGLPSDDVKIIYEARDGTLWIGTYSGLAKSEPSAAADGLTQSAGKTNSDISPPKFNRPLPLTVLTEKDGLAGNHIRSIFEDDGGVMWIGTYDGGLSRFKDGVFTNYTTENGLFSNGVFQILPDERGNFWMSSNQGIYRLARQQLNDFADGKITRIVSSIFGKSDGMLNTECNGGRSPAGIKTRDGKLWFPTQDGAAIINPASVSSNSLAPPVVIESVLIDNHPTEIRQSVIEIQPGQNNLEIHYTGLSFIKPEQMQFRYKLEGLDENWRDAANRREAYFPYLPPGKYTFRVIAANSDNVWNEQGASIEIVVKPAYYQTWWFLLLCAAAIGFFAFWLYERRLNEIRRRQFAQEDFSRRLINAHESERRRIAAELHDSIGQSLAMIKNRAVLSAESATDENTRRQINLITAQTTQTIGEVREISYALRPYLLDNLGLTKAVKSLLNQLTETSEITIECEIDEADNLFDGESEMSVYRIIQESLSNIIKHAEAATVQVIIKKSERNLTVLISDDGKGFDLNAVSVKEAGEGGFGLLGIAERVKMLGGTQEIESKVGGGTTVLIKIPLPEIKNKRR